MEKFGVYQEYRFRAIAGGHLEVSGGNGILKLSEGGMFFFPDSVFKYYYTTAFTILAFQEQ